MIDKDLNVILNDQLTELLASDYLPDNEKVKILYKLIVYIFIESSKEEGIHFTTFFSRMSYLGVKNKVPQPILFKMHVFRKNSVLVLNDKPSMVPINDLLELGYYILGQSMHIFLGLEIPKSLPLKINISLPDTIKKFSGFLRWQKVSVISMDLDSKVLLAYESDELGSPKKIYFDVPDINENFTTNLQKVKDLNLFPIEMSLIDIKVDNNGDFYPNAIVIQPDYLMDATAIAESFQSNDTISDIHLINKFKKKEITYYIMRGNVTNFFLDELILNPEVSFNKILPKIFNLNPIVFASYSDADLVKLIDEVRSHFYNIKNALKNKKESENFKDQNLFLEPTFLSSMYGVQGRLDLFKDQIDDNQEAEIIELKSGKTFLPNSYGLNNNHYTQTLMYDMLIKSTYGHFVKTTNYILYSKYSEKSLRFAPPVRNQQYEALKVRNDLVLYEYQLSKMSDATPTEFYLHLLEKSKVPTLKGFAKQEYQLFRQSYSSLKEYEKRHFQMFVGFLTREHILAKTGIHGYAKANGFASLWLDTLAEKHQKYNIVSHLKFQKIEFEDEYPIIHFAKSHKTNSLTNFRIGDIAILYPYDSEENGILENQLFKCTVLDLKENGVCIRLRNKQISTSYFAKFETWHLEHDVLDSGFTNQYKKLFEFISTNSEFRDLIFTARPPSLPAQIKIEDSIELTPHQNEVLRSMIRSNEYFLLWGPPGTGKTSMILKHFVSYELLHSNKTILLLAYTNRAVDEICASLETIPGLKGEYIRIGSKYSTHDKYKSKLLSNQIKSIQSRRELKQLILGKRVITGTLSSIIGKPELFELITFDLAVIDEASQILEPNLGGLLHHFKKFVLIGDHRQLPAVVIQDKGNLQVSDPILNQFGYKSLGDSLFERMFQRAKGEGWKWAYDQLYQQGRMHEDIMSFPSEEFYDGILKTIQSSLISLDFLHSPLNYRPISQGNILESLISSQRMIFIDTPINTQIQSKTNEYEANLVGDIIAAFKNLYEVEQIAWTANTLGVITPYRAQIAKIKEVIHNKNLEEIPISVDTIERYQGSARDIVILSLCTNRLEQIESMISLSTEGIDRKLNVALTRARKHQIILGNKEILKSLDIYNQLFKYCENVDYERIKA